MKALRKLQEGPLHLELVDVEIPEISEDEVLIEVAAAGVCGTDIKIKNGTTWSNPPVTVGHELSGKIVKMGKAVTGLAIGDRVVAETAQIICGKCYFCRTGNYLMCKDRLSIGYGTDGGMAEYVKIRQDIIHKVPQNVTLDEASLCEPAAVALHAVFDSVTILSTDTVLVAGAGAIGLLVAQIIKTLGAKVLITGLERDAKRLALAKELGIDLPVNLEQEDLKEVVMQQTNGAGVDYVFECSGSAVSINTCLGLVKNKGRFVQVGLTKPNLEIPYSLLTAREIGILGTFGHKWDSWERALQLIGAGKINVEKLITHRYPLAQWQEAFDVAERGEGIKVVIHPNGQAE